MACLQAIQLGLTLGLLGVVIEGDARSVICKLQAEISERKKMKKSPREIESGMEWVGEEMIK
ncbi:hypothetical protein Goklo_028016, partial [Gossypium klotzschianum]|nr:hypothetical protein [Gossypium klotzschianum]